MRSAAYPHSARVPGKAGKTPIWPSGSSPWTAQAYKPVLMLSACQRVFGQRVRCKACDKWCNAILAPCRWNANYFVLEPLIWANLTRMDAVFFLTKACDVGRDGVLDVISLRCCGVLMPVYPQSSAGSEDAARISRAFIRACVHCVASYKTSIYRNEMCWL